MGHGSFSDMGQCHFVNVICDMGICHQGPHVLLLVGICPTCIGFVWQQVSDATSSQELVFQRTVYRHFQDYVI